MIFMVPNASICQSIINYQSPWPSNKPLKSGSPLQLLDPLNLHEFSPPTAVHVFLLGSASALSAWLACVFPFQVAQHPSGHAIGWPSTSASQTQTTPRLPLAALATLSHDYDHICQNRPFLVGSAKRQLRRGSGLGAAFVTAGCRTCENIPFQAEKANI